MDADELGERVARVETRVARIESEIDMVRSYLGSVATKEDMKELRHWIERRDVTFIVRLWYLVFALVGVVAVIAGVKEAGNLFLG